MHVSRLNVSYKLIDKMIDIVYICKKSKSKKEKIIKV